MSSQSKFTVKLFYSYSHKDQKYREKIEGTLTLLRDQDGILKDWSDQRILPGEPISERIHKEMKKTDIFVFLLSSNFIESAECREEWVRAREIAKERPSVIRVPVILADCPWKDFEDMSQFKALPQDGKPIEDFPNQNTAWQQVYKELKRLVEELRKTFTIKDEFRKEMERTVFLSQEHVDLQSIFVFPALSSYTTRGGEDGVEEPIESKDQLLQSTYTLIYGEDLSGKTALCRHLFLSLVEDSKPVIYIDLDAVGRRATPDVFRDAYRCQFHGDYSLWEKQTGKAIILDNLSRSPGAIDHVLLATEYFDQVVVTLSTKTFYAYFRDEERLAQFREVEILPLTHNKQEKLIRRRMELSGQDGLVLDGRIDEIENRVNEIIISNRILPRYPFYVLSILQTYEGFMPSDLSITSYGHCYHILVIAHLSKSGIPRSDDKINTCLNFLENLAFEIYRSSSKDHCMGRDSLARFIEGYRSRYLIEEPILSRLFDQDYGIVTLVGQFKSPYMYYFFLGRFLARSGEKHKEVIERMLDRSYITSNCLTLIFTIHHTNDSHIIGIIEDILVRTMCALDDIEPSVLDREEAEIFEDVVAAIPSQILSSASVESEREKERNERDSRELEGRRELSDEDGEESVDAVNDIYRIMKNSEILGQILRNKYGSLERSRIVEIIETIADGGLRLVRLFLGHQREMDDIAIFIHKKSPELDLEEIKRAIRILSFVWTMVNVEKIVGALNKPEIQPLVKEVVAKNNTPAYELIEYFLWLDTIEQFSSKDREKLQSLWDKHLYPFFQRVISLRTQRYLNTHRVHEPIEQSVCSLLGIRYRPRLKRLG